MKEQLRKASYAFDELHEQIRNITEILALYEQFLAETAEESRTQNILQGLLRLLGLLEKDCLDFTEQLDILSLDYLHGRIAVDTWGIYAKSLKE